MLKTYYKMRINVTQIKVGITIYYFNNICIEGGEEIKKNC